MERIIVLVTALWQEREACNFILSHESQSESQLRTTGSSSLVVAQYISAEPQADVLLSSNSRFPSAHRLPRGQHNVSTTTWAASCMFSNSADIFSHETRVWSVEPNRSESISYLSQLAVTWWGMENPFHSLGFFLNPLNSTHRMCGGCGFLFCFFLGISVLRPLIPLWEVWLKQCTRSQQLVIAPLWVVSFCVHEEYHFTSEVHSTILWC